MTLDRTRPPNPFDHLPELPTFQVTSRDIADGTELPMTHVYSGAGGQDLSPHLTWTGFPSETKGFAVTCFDPDAPTTSGWWHWLLVDLPATTTELPTGAGTARWRPTTRLGPATAQ